MCLGFYNKWLFGKSNFNFEYPIFTMMIHSLIHTVLAYIVLQCYPSFKPVDSNVISASFQTLSLCSFVTAGDVGLSNLSLERISLTLYTIVKSTQPIFVLFFAIFLGIETISAKLIVSVLLIFGGVAMMLRSPGAQLDMIGLFQVQLATVISGLKWSLIQILLDKSKMGNPIVTMLNLSPFVAGWLFLCFLLIEGPYSLAHQLWMGSFDRGMTIMFSVIAGGFLAFSMVLLEFYIIINSSVVTLSIVGIFKEIGTIVLGVIVFGDNFTPVMLIGLLISLGGIGYYNYLRTQAVQNTDFIELAELDEDLVELDDQMIN
jgi:solute carrier family 35 protein C2